MTIFRDVLPEFHFLALIIQFLDIVITAFSSSKFTLCFDYEI